MTNFDQLEMIREVRGRRFLFAVERSTGKEDYTKYEELRNMIWEDPEDHFAGTRNMASENVFNEGGSLYIGVFIEGLEGEFLRDRDHLAAFTYGYVGVKNPKSGFAEPSNLVFYSQYAGVRPEYERYGLGITLKRFQGDVVQGLLGVATITCTYDPLVGANAYRNIHIFGMKVMAYKTAYYEDLGGKLNRIDVPGDRFFVSWNPGEKPDRSPFDVSVLLNEGGAVLVSEPVSISTASGPVSLDSPRLGKIPPKTPSGKREVALVEIPYDFYTLLARTDVPDPDIRRLPLDWRMASRWAFQELFDAGFRVYDFVCFSENGRKRDFYVLARS